MSAKIDWAKDHRKQLVRDQGADPTSRDNENHHVVGLATISRAELSLLISKYAKARYTLPDLMRMLELSGHKDQSRNTLILKEDHPLLYSALRQEIRPPFVLCPHCE
jgi:hypothetical protein